MSASLVGSEMCIRDSRRGAEAPRARACAFPVLAQALRAGQNVPSAALKCCLLYTSDAADDM
eukprot:1042886-Alexandrium_andersonii.AAC.1